MTVKRPETPFPRHWLIYIVLKLAMLALAIWLALRASGILESGA